MLETSLPGLTMKMRAMKIWGKILFEGGGEVDAEQVAQDNLLNHIKAQCEFGLWSNQHKSFKGLVSLSL